MKIAIDSSWRVTASSEIELPVRASAVWGQMRDWRQFLTIDPLHARVHSHAEHPDPRLSGDEIVIQHRVLGLGVDRIGRVLRWREGEGFAVSDLSRRGVRVGFPHVCMFDVSPLTERTSRLRITARGRWTVRFLPHFLVKLWLRWVMLATEARLRAHFRAFIRVTRPTPERHPSDQQS